MNLAFLQEAHADDHSGFVDGFDWDNIRWGYFAPAPDYNDPANSGQVPFMGAFGSSHPGVFNGVFCDGSIRSVKLDIDAEVFEFVCSRDDGAVYDQSEL